MEQFTVLDLIDLDLKEHKALELRCLGGRPGLVRELTHADLNRPGLALGGFYDNFAYQRIQVFGRGEWAFLEKMTDFSTVDELLGYPLPCCIFTHGLMPRPEFLERAEAVDCPVLQTSLSSSAFTIRAVMALSDVFAASVVYHGVLVEVSGIGILIAGESGVGKSETALELIERGHRLISDDSVELKRVAGNIVLGSPANKMAGHHMEIRGLGIINITHLFGVGAIRDTKQIQLLVKLEEWDSSKVYDRLGSGDDKEEILGVQIPRVVIPVKPGRNIPIIIETAAMNERLKKLGYHSAEEFSDNVLKWLESEDARALYFKKNDVF